MKNYIKLIALLALIFGTMLSAAEEEPVSVAVLDFSVPKEDKTSLGQEISELITVSLTLEDGLVLVEREALEKA